MLFITLPDLQRVPIDGNMFVPKQNTLVISNASGQTLYSYACVNIAGATAMAAQVDAAITAQATNFNSVTEVTDTGAIVWTSITPNTAAAGAYNPYYITGTGFMGSGINGIQFRGANSSSDYLNCIISSDTNIYPFSQGSGYPVAFQADVYTIYFSIDNGSTWATTGLTVTVS